MVWSCESAKTPEGKTDWAHYQQSRWEDVRQGGDSQVLQLIGNRPVTTVMA